MEIYTKKNYIYDSIKVGELSFEKTKVFIVKLQRFGYTRKLHISHK